MHPENLHIFEGFFSDYQHFFRTNNTWYAEELDIEHYREFIKLFNSYWWTESCILALNRSHAMILLSHLRGKCIVSMTYSFVSETWIDVDHCFIKLSDEIIDDVIIKCAGYFDKSANM